MASTRDKSRARALMRDNPDLSYTQALRQVRDVHAAQNQPDVETGAIFGDISTGKTHSLAGLLQTSRPNTTVLTVNEVRSIAIEAIRRRLGPTGWPEEALLGITAQGIGLVVHVNSGGNATEVRQALINHGCRVDAEDVEQPEYGVRIHVSAANSSEVEQGAPVLVVWGGRGGIGKSVVADRIAQHATARAKRVVLVDAGLFHGHLKYEGEAITVGDAETGVVTDFAGAVTAVADARRAADLVIVDAATYFPDDPYVTRFIRKVLTGTASLLIVADGIRESLQTAPSWAHAGLLPKERVLSVVNRFALGQEVHGDEVGGRDPGPEKAKDYLSQISRCLGEFPVIQHPQYATARERASLNEVLDRVLDAALNPAQSAPKPKPKTDDELVLEQSCPYCEAQPGEPCVMRGNGTRSSHHMPRRAKASSVRRHSTQRIKPDVILQTPDMLPAATAAPEGEVSLMVEVTHLHCPESGAPEGADNSTHHLVPRSAGRGAQQMVCAYCGKTEKALRDAAQGPGTTGDSR